jgi:hypothetical protein
VASESNILEEISAARRRAEKWLKEAEDYLSKSPELLEGERLSGKQARKEIEALTCLEDEGSSCLKDLKRLLGAASNLIPVSIAKFRAEILECETDPVTRIDRSGADLGEAGRDCHP